MSERKPMKERSYDDERFLLRQAPSPSERVQLLKSALSERIDIEEIAEACGVDWRVVARWEETGLYGDLSAREIRRLIEESQQRRQTFIDDFIAEFRRSGLRTARDLELAGISDMYCEPPCAISGYVTHG